MVYDKEDYELGNAIRNYSGTIVKEPEYGN
jgi:hypothetical protein